tara:strand:+ start:277 stop:534 length:258 start_codon:yes stop_codon:yes gene_type:complete
MTNQLFEQPVYHQPTNEQLYVCFMWQSITEGHYAPCGADELEEAARLLRELIKEHGEDFDLISLNKKVIELLVNDDKPEILKDRA